MRRLRHQQEVEIHLDGEDEVVLGCRVMGVEGSVATLASVDAGPGPLLGGSVPAVPGYLLFDHSGGRVALKGIATANTSDGPELLFVVIDGVQLPERRSAARARVNAVARMFHPDSADESGYFETRLADLSVSGMRVEGHASLNGAIRYRLELYIGDAQTPIRCGAEIARRTPTHVGLKFIDLEEADRTLLDAIVRAHAES
jgi:PilZ domain